VAAVVGSSSAAKAAVDAGYKEKTSKKRAWLLLQEPEIKAAVEKRQDEICKKLGITRERILREYARLAFADIGNVMSWDCSGVLLEDSKKLKPEFRAAVAEVTETKTKDGGSTRLKMHDKKGPLDALAKALGILADRSDEDSGDVHQTIRMTLVDDTEEPTPQEKLEDDEK